MSPVTIYYNPRCSKCRQTLQLIEEKNIEPVVIEYLTDPPDVNALKMILEKLALPEQAPVELTLIREKEYRELNLPATSDVDELLAQIAANPQVLQRPIVINGNNARICRPPEKVLEIL